MSLEAANPSSNRVVRLDKISTIIPSRPSQGQHCNLCSSDLRMLYVDYIQNGLIYQMPFTDDHHFISVVEVLKKSLAEVLVHFYPLAGRLITSSDGLLYIYCNDAGADFIEASAPDVGIEEVTSPEVVPVVRQLFALDGAINVDGRFLPLLVVQVTKLRDGVAIGFTVNHAVVDGTSLWHFINSWADICRGATTISHPPLHSRCFDIKDSHIAVELPQTQTVRHLSPPPLREKVFHFSKETISRLKDKANRDKSEDQIIISSFEALSAQMWHAITRARGLLPHEPTTLKLAVNCRSRLIPPLPYSYFGNAIQVVTATVTAGELLAADISSTASLLHHIISQHTDASIRAEQQRFNEHRTLMKLDKIIDDNIVLIGSSARFPMYDNDFGWGRPARVRSGRANKLDGIVSVYPAREGGGSVDLEISLLPRFMAALEADPQFLFPVYD
eukprot:PITA_32621